MLTTKNQQELADWLWERAGWEGRGPKVTCFGKKLNDRLVAVVGYSHYNSDTKSVYAHIAGDTTVNWLTRDLLWFLFAYPYIQLKVDVIFAPVVESNIRCLKFLKHLGFIQHRQIPEVFESVNAVIMSLSKRDCQFLNQPKVIKWVE